MTYKHWMENILVVVCGASALGQTTVNLKSQSRNVDFAGSVSTRPFKMGTVLPASCVDGEMFFHSIATAGQNVYACSSGVWANLQAQNPVPAATGQTGKVLGSDGTAAGWRAFGGDVSGAPNALKVERLQGRGVSPSAPQDGNVVRWNSAANLWVPADMTDFNPGMGIRFTGATISVEDALTPQYAAGVGPPSGSCQPGRDLYVDIGSQGLYYCGAADVWKGAGGGTGTHDASAIVSGVLDTNRLPATAARTERAQEWSAGATQTFHASASAAGERLAPGTLPGAPQAGDVAVDADDSNTLKWYDGTIWRIAGGSGAVLPLIAKGDMVVHNGAAIVRQPSGAAGSLLMSDATQSTGVRWAKTGPRPNSRRWAYAVASGASTTFGAIGDSISALGTFSSVGPSSTDGLMVQAATAATANSDALWAGSIIHRMGRNLLFQTYFSVQQTTGIRVWVGLTSANTAGPHMAADDPATTDLAMFRYSTLIADANWICTVKNGTTLSTADSGVAVSTQGRKFEIELDDTNGMALFSIDGQRVCSMGSNLPRPTTTLRMLSGARTLEDVAKQVRASWFYMESDR